MGMGLGGVTEANWPTLVTHLEMSHTQLGALLDERATAALLARFPNLRVCHLNDSQLAHRHAGAPAQPLASLFGDAPALEELCLEENALVDVSALAL